MREDGSCLEDVYHNMHERPTSTCPPGTVKQFLIFDHKPHYTRILEYIKSDGLNRFTVCELESVCWKTEVAFTTTTTTIMMTMTLGSSGATALLEQFVVDLQIHAPVINKHVVMFFVKVYCMRTRACVSEDGRCLVDDEPHNDHHHHPEWRSCPYGTVRTCTCDG